MRGPGFPKEKPARDLGEPNGTTRSCRSGLERLNESMIISTRRFGSRIGPRDQSGSEQPQENIRTFVRCFVEFSLGGIHGLSFK